MSVLLPSTPRPNGKVYRPRKPPEVFGVRNWDDVEGVLVRGTLNVDVARDLARPEWDRDCNYGVEVENAPTLTDWYRLVPWANDDFDNSWIVDEAHGAPCVVFGAWAS